MNTFAELSDGDSAKFLVRWRGRQEGPYLASVIEAKLAANEISLLHEIFYDGKWVTIRDYITKREAILRAELQAREEQERRAQQEAERQAREREERRRAELLAEERRRSAQLESVQSRENSDQHLHQPMPTTNGGLSVLRTLGMLLLIAGLAITGYFFMASDTSVKRAAFVPVTPMNIAQKAFPSVVMIVMEDADGQPNAMGSGFFVSEGVVASNFHVIESASRGFVKKYGDETKYEIDGVIALDEFHDLVLLQVKAANAPLLSLGDSKNLAIGEEVFVVGNPEGFEGTFSKGIVSGIRESESKRYVQITAPISHGSSGGPVLNGKAEVIGVTVAIHESGQNLNFAIPSQYLKELLAKKGDLKPIQSSSKRVTQN